MIYGFTYFTSKRVKDEERIIDIEAKTKKQAFEKYIKFLSEHHMVMGEPLGERTK